MKNLFVFYNSNFDSALQARGYADEGTVHAKAINKAVLVAVYDTSAAGADLTYFAPSSTIQCVSVDGTTVQERQINPPNLSVIDGMIDRL